VAEQNPTPGGTVDDAQNFDVVVLGGGSGGYACALRSAELGKRVLLIEEDKLGGTCLHRGCIPTKALLHSGEIADNARDASHFGVNAIFESIDMTAVNAYKDGVVSRLHRGLQGLVKSRNITYVEGHGRLVARDAVEVNGTRYTGKNVVLATGSVPKSLPGLLIDGVQVITSDHALSLDHVPARVIVLGGGVIGCEFASVWKSFGAEVTIVEALPHLVPTEEESSSKLLERAFRKRGINFEIGVKFAGVTIVGNEVKVKLENGKELEADILLVAVGRGPVSQGLGYEEAGLKLDRGFLIVDEKCHTNVEGIYAVGDLIPTLQLAHVGFGEGILVAEEIAGLNPAPINYAGVPRVTYSEPEVASVGLTSEQAKAKGLEIVEITYDLAGNGKAQILRTSGAVKVIAQKDGPVLGVHMVGSRVGELLAEAQLIYNWEAYPSDVASLIHAHPTMSEAIGEAHLALAGKPLHVHG
jgi:dihydrolipoamide dehydrogenase